MRALKDAEAAEAAAEYAHRRAAEGRARLHTNDPARPDDPCPDCGGDVSGHHPEHACSCLDRDIAYPSASEEGVYSYGPCCGDGCVSWRFIAPDGEIIGDHIREAYIVDDLGDDR